MIHNFFIFFSVLISLSLIPLSASAQNCDVNYEVIYNLTKPKIGSYSVWNNSYGEMETQERFKSGVLAGDEKFVVIGENFKHKRGAMKLMLKKLEKRGRAVWEKEFDIPGLASVKKIMHHPKGFAVFGAIESKDNKRAHDLWIGLFDAEGNFLGEKRIARSGEDVQVTDVYDRPDLGYYVVSLFLKPTGIGGNYSRVVQINYDGKVLIDRAFKPGLENQILSVERVDDRAYLATGYIRIDDGRRVAWVLRLDQDLNIVWEREFPRGKASKMNGSSPFIRDFAILVGEVIPYGSGNNAAWVMVISKTSGEIGWQRYYSGDMHFSANDVLTSRDGLMSVLVSGARPSGMEAKDNPEYVRLLTINPRGVMFIGDEYFNASGAYAYDMFFGPNDERIMLGSTYKGYQIEREDDEPPEVVFSHDAWILAAAQMEHYKDPCREAISPF